jgi:hypothetical protein
MFNDEHSHPPVIILLDGKAKAKNMPFKNWLQESRFSTCEPSDLLSLMEDITDYTLSERPDVFILEVDSVRDDLNLIHQFIQTTGTDETDLPVLALAGDDKCPDSDDCFVGSLQQVKEKLNAYIPESLRSKAAINNI